MRELGGRGDRALPASRRCVSSAALQPMSEDVVTRVLELLADAFYERLSDRDAIQFEVTRTAAATQDSVAAVGLQIQALPDGAWRSQLGSFHPARSDEAIAMSAHWPTVRVLVDQLGDPRDRADVLSRWTKNRPIWWDEAPAHAMRWLGSVASDVSNHDATRVFFQEALERGIAPRAPLQLQLLQIESPPPGDLREWFGEATAAENHPAFRVAIADAAEDESARADALAEWEPLTDGERVFREFVAARVALSCDDLAGAIEIGEDALSSVNATGAALMSVRALLLLSGQELNGAQRFAYLKKAGDLALEVRRQRREWGGPTADATVLAMAAMEAMGDPQSAWRISQSPPQGDATEVEARDEGVASRAIQLAADLGKDAEVERIRHLVRPTVYAQASARLAHHRDDPAAAQLLLEAYREETDATRAVGLAFDLAYRGVFVSLDRHELNGREDLNRVLRLIAELFLASPAPAGAVMSEARSLAYTDRLMAVGLHRYLRSVEDFAAAAELMESAAQRWGEAHMWLWASDSYRRAKDWKRATATAQRILTIADLPLEMEKEANARVVEASSAGGDTSTAIAAAMRIRTLAPADQSIRWALIRLHLSASDPKEALAEYVDAGRPAPRMSDEALALARLHYLHGEVAIDAHSLLQATQAWAHDEDVRGRVLLSILLSSSRQRQASGHDNEESVDDDDLPLLEAADDLALATEESRPPSAVATAIAAFVAEFPDSRIMWQRTIDRDDVLASVARAFGEQPDTSELDRLIFSGRLPVGFASEIYSKGYAEILIVTDGSPRFAGPFDRAARELADAEDPAHTTAVIDSSAIHTLALMDTATRTLLVGCLQRVLIPTTSIEDVRSSQLSLDRASGLSISMRNGRPVAHRVDSEDLAAQRATASTMLQIAEQVERISPSRDAPADPEEDLRWLSAVDAAESLGIAVWADDVALRTLAAERAVPTFSTSTLLERLQVLGRLTSDEANVVRAAMVSHGHVGFPVEEALFKSAGQLAAWNARVLASTLRFGVIETPQERVRFCVTAMTHNQMDPEALGALAYGLAAWGKSLADRSATIRILASALVWILRLEWLRPEMLPFVLEGLRNPFVEAGEEIALVEVVSRILFQRMAAESSPAIASDVLRGMFAYASEADRLVVTGVVMTTEV